MCYPRIDSFRRQLTTVEIRLSDKWRPDRRQPSVRPVVSWIVAAAAAVLSSVTAGQAADDRPNLVFCCNAENDLYRVIAGDGMGFPRFDSALAAIDAAEEGAGVLILADGYPRTATPIDLAGLDLAAKKSLRLYVEYPASLPGVEVGKPRRTRVERAVVTSDFFGRELGQLRIVAINGLHFVPVSCEKSHIVAARVAGFDTAVFGLPKRTDPILFEHPGGNLLVSTTKLARRLYRRIGDGPGVSTSTAAKCCPMKS